MRGKTMASECFSVKVEGENLDGIKIIPYEVWLMAKYSTQCVNGGYGAEGRSSARLNNEIYTQIEEDLSSSVSLDYRLGPIDSNARNYDVEVTNLESTFEGRPSRGTSTRLVGVHYGVPSNEENVHQRVLECEPPEARMLDFTETKNALDGEPITRAHFYWAKYRAKYGIASNSVTGIGILSQFGEGDFGDRQLRYPEVPCHGTPCPMESPCCKLIEQLNTSGETVIAGLPGITRKSTMFWAGIEKDEEKAAATIVEQMKYDQLGARVKPHWLRRTLAASYVILSICVSLLSLGFNWTGKNNILERILDATAIITLMLISFFGLVKLKSEDPTILRNILLNRRVLKSPSSVERYYVREASRKTKLNLRQAVLAAERPLRWLNERRACYARSKPTGNIVLVEGLATREAWDLGLLVNEVICLDFKTGRNYMNTYTADLEYHKGGDSGFLRMYEHNEFTSNNYTAIAGLQCRMQGLH